MYELIIVESKTSKSEVIKKTDERGQEFWIPMDEANSDYQEYLRWVEENN
jgi:hypothetical protein